MDDEDNHSAIITYIEDQIVLSKKMETKVKVIMKKIYLRYANEVIDVTSPINFCVIMDTLKQEIISKLILCEIDHEKSY